MVWCSLHGVPTPGSKQQLSRQDVEDAVEDWPPPRQPQSVPGRRQRRVICASCNQTLHMHHPCSTLPLVLRLSIHVLYPSPALRLSIHDYVLSFSRTTSCITLLALNCDHVIPYHDFLAKHLYHGHKPPLMTDFVFNTWQVLHLFPTILRPWLPFWSAKLNVPSCQTQWPEFKVLPFSNWLTLTPDSDNSLTRLNHLPLK